MKQSGKSRIPRLRAMRDLCAVLLLLPLAGCAAHVGPRTVVADRFDYSEALTRSWKEQMLLNMVKLRYAEPPVFLDVQQVVQQYTREGSGSIFAPGWTGDTTIAPAASVSGRWAESPTITHLPMTGERFTKSLLQPVAPVELFSLVEAGWPVDAVFHVGVRSINGLHAGSRTALMRRPADPDFYRVTAMLRELQLADGFGVQVEGGKEGAASILVLHPPQPDQAALSTARKVRELLHLDPDAKQFKLVFSSVQQDSKELAMVTRSMLEILAEAAAGVEIPSADIEEGRVMKMDTGSGTDEGPRFAVRVRSSTSPPEPRDAFTAVRFRNHWFWIDDRDVPSKRGLGFLMVLFTLVQSGTAATPPLLTLTKP